MSSKKSRSLAYVITLTASLSACSAGSAGDSKDGSTLDVAFTLQAIESGTERQGDLATQLPSDEPVFVTSVEWSAPKGMHHGRLDAPPEGGIGYAPILGLPVQENVGNVSFPVGYALPLAAHQPLAFAYHYVNATRAPIDGAVTFRLHVLPKGARAIALGMLALENEAIEIAPRSTTRVTTSCPLDRALLLHSLLAHTHALGRGVDAFVVGGAHDGERIYTTTQWAEAPIVTLDPPLALEAGTSIRFVCTYTNAGNVAVRYGASAGDEMCVIAGHYSVGGEAPPPAIAMGAPRDGGACVASKR